ncbi:hypothetical protein NIES4075_13900 [Tolypothrix sp. NIES-4075]|uniref:molybdopterin-dependent oxidoreductase n=1 Tax=Tolypothrix sp. NIES-4075 TaxID=2005459 RepID=UPI000B5C26C3|nr:molybdopterin-dependent oxidoreductase [Tolypothrix sp. NIES-4075]GAX40425.1 hypothetical protein NIES4075_13900 [Tolypothrix sp. NIES-4075]
MRLNRDLEKLILTTLFVCLQSCTTNPTDAQLKAWRKQASDRNAQIVAANTNKEKPSQWNLEIQGETATGKPVELNWQQLHVLATEQVKTPDPTNIIQPNQVFDFRGIKVATLIKQFGVASDVSDVTFVGFDSYHTTILLQDLQAYPIILAIAKNNKPIKRDEGGPIYLVFPFAQYPQLRQKYNETNWAFYVSHMIFGTEKARVRVNKRELDLATLDKLPQVTINETVGYRLGWSSGKVKLHGVRLRDVLKFAGEKLPEQGKVKIRGKARFYDDAANLVRLSYSEMRECDVILATKWGNERQLIPAKMGGPVTLAFGSQCPSKTNQTHWVKFVEELTTAQ